jgi:hypothetical protein
VENARLRDEIRAAAAEKGLMVPDMEEGIMAAAAAAAAAVAVAAAAQRGRCPFSSTVSSDKMVAHASPGCT